MGDRGGRGRGEEEGRGRDPLQEAAVRRLGERSGGHGENSSGSSKRRGQGTDVTRIRLRAVQWTLGARARGGDRGRVNG
ncbi:hypothetical protein GCM10017778_42240 [Streptomyces vinaceus]|nr:hypothetical protein GCM10017778_42240 [Streptomyces vinaceus]